MTENKDYAVLEYQIEPSLLAYLQSQKLLDDDLQARRAAADFMLWLMQHERHTYAHLALTIQALHRAERHAEADRLTLDILVKRYTLDGHYAKLLTRWLPQIINSQDPKARAEALGQMGKLHIHLGSFQEALPYLKQSLEIMRQIGDKAGEGAALNNISALYHAQGDYETALGYLKQSLEIVRQIGDKAGLCATLFNIGHIHAQKEEFQQAVSAWVTAYVIARQIGYAQVLQALAGLAPKLGLPVGLDGWEELAKKRKDEG